MTALSRGAGVAGVIAGVALLGCRAAPRTGGDEGAAVRVPLAEELPPMDGGHLKATVVEVSYGPGGSSPPHSHPCPVMGYVIEGALRVQVQGQAESTYRAGQSFYETPNGVHLVSANASDTRPVRFLAHFVCDHDAPLSAPVTTAAAGGAER